MAERMCEARIFHRIMGIGVANGALSGPTEVPFDRVEVTTYGAPDFLVTASIRGDRGEYIAITDVDRD